MRACSILPSRSLVLASSAVCATTLFQLASYSYPCIRQQLSTTRASFKKSDQLPPRPSLPPDEVKHVYLKGSGPGGQKINKTASAVQVTHLPTGIVVKSQATRSRSQNETIARRLLAERIELLEKGTESRIAKKAERKQKKKASASKKTRRKYKKLEEERKLKETGDNGTTTMDAGAATAAAIGIGGLGGEQMPGIATADDEKDLENNEDKEDDDNLQIGVAQDELEVDEAVETRVEDTLERAGIENHSSKATHEQSDGDLPQYTNL